MSKSVSLWWPRYVGDYQRKTAHLSLTEHGAYTLLLDHYYATGSPIPANASVLHRICRAFADEEKAAVQDVLDQFFILKEDGYHNKTADEQLLKRGDITEKRKKAAEKRHANAGANAGANASTSTSTSTPIEKKEDKSSFQKNDEPSTTQMPKLIFDEKPGAKNVKRKSTLKDDWKPNDNHRAKCAERGIDAGKLCEEFRNYHLARGNLFADWDRAFFTWIGNAERFGGGKTVGVSGQPGVGGIVEAGLRVAARYKNQG